jgi:DNA invertase Pin-like site-specific DNA recombinase
MGTIKRKNVFLEGLLNIFSEIEENNIARRTKEARKRYPLKKLGYKKHKEPMQYRQDPNKKKH